MSRKIEVVPYDPSWVRKYETEAEKLLKIFGDQLIEIHHIGSTAILDMVAKPTIDILGVVKDIKAVDEVDRAMQEMGYQPKGENGIPGRRYFQKMMGEVHHFHLHTFEDGHPEIDRLLNFRDYLRTHPDTALQYQALKENLAAEFTFEPDRYTEGKGELIQQIDQRAVDWRISDRKRTLNAG